MSRPAEKTVLQAVSAAGFLLCVAVALWGWQTGVLTSQERLEALVSSLGIAGALLNHACRDMAELGVGTLYLLTDHTSFYERYGWEFLCMVRGDGEEQPSRMYVRRWEDG
ncbi:hypothetical protein [uncultured Oscillibacter sp.]|uniref:hypothetical protein n=1 Tax=uncultured Oscillibacter sp. TaxID=876091 RepID=UPI0034557B0D